MASLPENLVESIVQEYERQLIIPDRKPEHQFILCPVGLVGAGKTTVVKPLSERLSLLRVSGDEIRKILNDKGYDYDKVQEIATILASKYLDQGYSMCSDNDCVTEKTQNIMNNLSKKYNLKLVWIHINPPEEFILNKLKTHQGGWMGNEALIQNYFDRKPLHQNLNLPFVYTLDTSKSTLPDQIKKAEEIIRKFTNNYSSR